MRNTIKSLFGIGVVVGLVLLGIGFVAYLFGTLNRIAIFAGTVLCSAGLGYAQIGGDDEVRDMR